VITLFFFAAGRTGASQPVQQQTKYPQSSAQKGEHIGHFRGYDSLPVYLFFYRVIDHWALTYFRFSFPLYFLQPS